MAWTDKDGNISYVDNVLCYIQNKVKITDVDTVVSLCDPVFEPGEIEVAKKKLFALCHAESDKSDSKTRRGQHKNKNHIRDICTVAPCNCPSTCKSLIQRTSKNFSSSHW